jgi:lysophospholipase L1-like esterase
MQLSPWKSLLFASIPTLVLVAAAEGLVRLTGAAESCPTYQSSLLWVCDPILYFKTRATVPVALNKDGFRGRDFGPKAPRMYRILALGDSCTFGITSQDEGTFAKVPYPQRLEHLIAQRTRNKKVEVLNGGVPGYNSYQGIMLLRGKLRGLEPDLITVRYGWNDHLMSPEGRIGNAFHEPAEPWVRLGEDLLLRTKLYPFARRLGMELKLRFQETSPAPPQLPREWKPNVTLQQYEHNLRRIVELAREQGAAVWLLTSPSAFLTPDLLARYEALPAAATTRILLNLDRIPSFRRMMEIHDSYNAATRAIAAELHVPLIDMDEIYRRHADKRLFSMLDIVHPVQEGHDLEAEALYTRLVAEGIIAQPRNSPVDSAAPAP